MKCAQRLVITTLCLLFFLSGCVTQTTPAVVSTPSASSFTTPNATPTPTATPLPTATPSPTRSYQHISSTFPIPALPLPDGFPPMERTVVAPNDFPHYVQWATINDQAIFTDQDIKNISIPWNMPREQVIDLFGLPPKWEVFFEEATGNIYSIDRYWNDNKFYFLYDRDQKKYFLSDAFIRSKDIEGPRGLQVGDTAKEVLDAFYIERNYVFLDDYKDPSTILYGNFLYDFFSYPYAPCGYIYEWNDPPRENIYYISYDYCPEDDFMYQDALAGGVDYFAVCLYSCVFTITDDKISSMHWRYGANGE